MTRGLFKLDLKGTRIDLREKIAFVDELAFLECDTDELTVDAAANRDGIERSDSAKAVEIDGQVATLGSGNNNRHNHVGCAESSCSSALGGCRRGRGRIGRLARILGAAIIPAN